MSTRHIDCVLVVVLAVNGNVLAVYVNVPFTEECQVICFARQHRTIVNNVQTYKLHTHFNIYLCYYNGYHL